jgi:hypothetical protein
VTHVKFKLNQIKRNFRMNQTFETFIAFHISMCALQLNISALHNPATGSSSQGTWMDGDVYVVAYTYIAYIELITS